MDPYLLAIDVVFVVFWAASFFYMLYDFKKNKLDFKIQMKVGGSSKTIKASIVMFLCLFIDGQEVDINFALASRNIVGVDVLPTIGANVYDILRRDKLVLTKDAVSCLEERLK